MSSLNRDRGHLYSVHNNNVKPLANDATVYYVVPPDMLLDFREINKSNQQI